MSRIKTEKSPSFIENSLNIFQELHSNHEDLLKRELILWSNRDINIVWLRYFCPKRAE